MYKCAFLAAVLGAVLITGCSLQPLINDLENDCQLTTTVTGSQTTETWQCSGEDISDDDLAVMTINGVTK